MSYHPVCAIKGGVALFFDGAATPPSKGGESPCSPAANGSSLFTTLITPKTSLAKRSTPRPRCWNRYDRVASRSFLHQLCEADLRRQIRIDSESDRRHARDMPAHLLSSARR